MKFYILVFLVLVVSTMNSVSSNCHSTSCVECVALKSCVFVLNEKNLVCLEKSRLGAIKPTAVYRTKVRCHKLEHLTPSSSMGTPIKQSQLSNAKEHLTPSTTVTQKNQSQLSNAKNQTILLISDTGTENTSVHLSFYNGNANLSMREIWMRSDVDYEQLKKQIVESACMLETLFRKFGDVRMLHISDIPEFKWVRMQMANPMSLHYDFFCKNQ